MKRRRKPSAAALRAGERLDVLDCAERLLGELERSLCARRGNRGDTARLAVAFLRDGLGYARREWAEDYFLLVVDDLKTSGRVVPGGEA